MTPLDVFSALPSPCLGLGLAAVGRPAYITSGRASQLGPDRSVEALRRDAFALLDAAFSAGVGYYDVARSYGRAEEFLAGWLQSRGVEPGRVAVGSKWGYTYVGDWRMDAEKHEVQDLSVAAFERQSAETLSLLGSHLSLYQIHSASPDNGVLADAAVLDAMRRFRETHGVRLGLTVTGARQAETIDQAVELGMFDSVQATWNLLEPSSGDALSRAHDAGLTVIVKEALANGRLTADGDQPALIAAAAARGIAPDTLALSAVLAQPWVDIVLSGAVTPDTLAGNLAADAALWDGALELAEPAEDYWRARSQRAWA
jgi:aryl-alcohol dehydrogenase-like predicted oxidoreductase